MNRPLGSREYEQLVEKLINKLANWPGVEGIFAGPGNHIHGASGQPHQIDVSITTETDLILLECKELNRAVELAHSLIFAARLDDIRKANLGKNVTGSIVSTKTAAEGVHRIAAAYNFNVDIVASEEEYVVSITNRHFVGLKASAVFSDSCSWQ